MARKITFFVLAVFALLFLPFADCMFSASHDQQSMQCCGSMPCDPSNQSHDCCKGMVSSQASSLVPTAHVTPSSPMLVAADLLPSPQTITLSEVFSADFAVSQHSPPELYTLHSSLLI